MSSSPQRGSPSSVHSQRMSLENSLQAKLTAMENSLARVASVRAKLRKNAEQTRRDLSTAVSAQMESLRNREQQLVVQLEESLTKKEMALNSQQEMLNQHIGACQQSLECLRRSSGGSLQQGIDVQEMLFRLNSLDATPRSDPYLTLNADTMRLRAAIQDWGSIKDQADGTPVVGESLPVELEEIDDAPMAHKTVMWKRQQQMGRGGENEKSAQLVRDWINQMPTAQAELAADIGAAMEEEMKSTDSFEVIDRQSIAETLKFATENRANTDWLLPGLRPAPYTATIAPTAAASATRVSMQRPTTIVGPPADGNNLYGFERVIARLMKSGNEEWLVPGASNEKNEEEEKRDVAMERLREQTNRMNLSESMAERIRAMQKEEEKEKRERLARASSIPDQIRVSLSPTRPTPVADWTRVFDRSSDTTDKWLTAKSS